MFRGFLIYFYRGFIRNWQCAIINIFGLSAGLSCTIIITLYSLDEFMYDRFHADAEQIYRFNTRYGPQNEAVPLGPYILNEHLLANIPEIRGTVRIRPEYGDDFWFRYGDRNYVDQGFLLADSNFFSFFSFPLIQGDPGQVLSEPNSIVITESAAKRIFGDRDPFGETILVQGMYPATVTGIMEDFPRHSHFQASIIANNEIARNYASFLFGHWGNFSWHYYLKLADHVDHERVAGKITDMVYEIVPEIAEIAHFGLQPLLDIRLHSERIVWDIDSHGHSTLLHGLIAAAIIILLLASVNYINLYTVQATTRKKEIAIRKVMGAGPGGIFLRSITESFIYIVISFIIALGMVEILLPVVNELSGKMLDPAMLFSFPTWTVAMATILLFTFLSGFYPAIVANRFQPISIFRGGGDIPAVNRLPAGSFKLKFRHILIVFQFCCATALIILTLSVNRQIRYMMDVDYGYRDSGLFVVNNPVGEDRESRFYNLKNILEQHTEIDIVTAGYNVPTERLSSFTHIRMPGDDHEVLTGIVYVDIDYFSALGSEIVAGRFFDPEYRLDTVNSIVINRTAARALGTSPGEIIGKDLISQNSDENLHVIGVIEDIHFFSLHELITPMLFIAGNQPQTYEKILISANKVNLSEAIDKARDVWQEEYGHYPFNFSIIEEKRTGQYSRENQTQKVTGLFMTLAIVISLMGLYSLASFIINARVKEIAVRKVMGAGRLTISRMVFAEFTMLVSLSVVVAWPLAWFVLSRWLENFAYRQDLNYFYFLAAALISLAAAWISILFQANKAASVNPAKILKYQ